MQQQNNVNNTSWVLIIVMLILFWPVGGYLLWKKLSTDRSATMKSGKGIQIVGWLLVAVGAIIILDIIENGMQPGDFVTIMIFGGAGATLVAIGNRTNARAKKYRKYIAIVANQDEKEISTIAGILNLPPETVTKDLTEMIERKFFGNAYIDHRTNSIVINTGPAKKAEPKTYKAVQCQGCRAINKVAVGEVTTCEFCRSMIIDK